MVTVRKKVVILLDKPNYYIVSFSGGKDSTAMLLHLLELGEHIDEILFCDTTMEFPEMYAHIEKVKKAIESYDVKFTTLKPPFDFEYFLLKKKIHKKDGGIRYGYSWATSRSRWCTSKLKVDVVNRYLRDLKTKYNIIKYVGLAADEQYRLDRKNNKAINVKHPLVTWGWTEHDCLLYCKNLGYTWGGLYDIYDRCSCWCCPLQGVSSCRVLWKYHPKLWEKLKEWDREASSNFMPNYTVDMLEAKFELEVEREREGLTINPRTKEFREALARAYKEKGLTLKKNEQF